MHNYNHPPLSCEFCRHILYTETFDEACARWQDETRELEALRTANTYHSTQKEIRTMSHTDPPNPYDEPLRALRLAHGITIPDAIPDDDPRLTTMQEFRQRVHDQAMQAALHVEPSVSKTHLIPPDGYTLALERMRADR